MNLVPILRQPDLEMQFRALGLTRGMMVEVHSSLSSFGCVEAAPMRCWEH